MFKHYGANSLGNIMPNDSYNATNVHNIMNILKYSFTKSCNLSDHEDYLALQFLKNLQEHEALLLKI